MSLSPTLAEETKFILEFDDELPEFTTIAQSLMAWGIDPLEQLMAQQELERDELMAYLRAHLH